jgi:hypothetical protein
MERIRESRGVTWSGAFSIAVMVLVASRGVVAQDDADEGSMTVELLIDLISALDEGDRAPSVLDGLDLTTAPPEERKIARVLKENRTDIFLEKASVRDAIEVLRAVSGLNFAISGLARKAIEEEKPQVTVSLRGLPLENVLNLVAGQLAGFRFIVQYGAVVLVRAEECRPRKFLCVYDVRDLLYRPRDFPAPKLALPDCVGTQP